MNSGRDIGSLMDLSGRAALITGAAGHIGAACADALAELGCRIAICDRDPQKCRQVAESIAESRSVETTALAADLADETSVKALPEQVTDAFGRLDILVQSAAFVGDSELSGWAVPFAEQSAETWRAALEVNLTATFVLAQAAAPHLGENGVGSVVNVSSIYGMMGPDLRLYEGTGMGNPAAYAAGKGGLLQLTRWLATVLAPDVRVNAVSPGGIRRNQPDSFIRRYEENTPLGRMGTEEDVKGAVAYLAGDLSAYVTGQNLIVDGGWTAW
ncbi:MAG: SDR family oxidoreductase [Rhodospirillales bacterium]|nr:SDR family oxidoreductase [Rhodospirillales bacterium]